MIIHLDSSFRNITSFPFPTEFEIQVNSTPLDRTSESDARSLYNTQNYILFSFRWIGDTTNPIINAPLPSPDNKDSILIKFIPISPSTVLLVNPDFGGIKNDYFVGLIFIDKASQMSSLVGSYETSARVLTMTDPIFQEYYDGCGIGDPIPDILEKEGFLVNTTYWYKNNLLILGSTNMLKTSISEFILAKGLNTNLYIENVTQNWMSKIKSFAGPFRNVVLEAFPSYHHNDFWIVWQTPYRIRKDAFHPLFISGIQSWQIIDSSEGFCIGDILTIDQLTFSVADVSKTGRVLELRLQSPGEKLHIGQLIELIKDVDKIVVIRVIDVGIVLQYNNLPPSIYLKLSSFLIAILDINQNNVFYYSILYHTNDLIYLDISINDAISLNENVFNERFITYFIMFYSYLPNIVAPVIPYQNPICYAVRILSITLPNKPVCGFNVLLADFPFVLVTLVNKNSASGENVGTLISNIPSTASPANFVCPIANIRNPDIVKFVVVSSNQVVNFRFTPNNTIFFRVSLPNGNLLKYNIEDNSKILLSVCNDNSLTPFCTQNNMNLNNSVHPNSKIVYAYSFENLVSATFQFDPL